MGASIPSQRNPNSPAALSACGAEPLYLGSMTAPDRTVAFRIDKPAPDRAEAAARRAEAVQRIRDETGIDEALIDALVESFYARVRNDD